jgi:hypothetical protein
VIDTALSVATELLAREMIVLEQAATQADGDLAERLWFQRDEVRHQRSLLLRQIWVLATMSERRAGSGSVGTLFGVGSTL